jgi:hypothetical protein
MSANTISTGFFGSFFSAATSAGAGGVAGGVAGAGVCGFAGSWKRSRN